MTIDNQNVGLRRIRRNDETVPPAVQLAAAGMILDRAYGKPRQMIETASEVGRLRRC